MFDQRCRHSSSLASRIVTRFLWVSRLLFVGVALVSVVGCSHREEIRRPNVIVVVIDTLRADHLSHFGYQHPTAPALDRLRNQSTVFTEAYAPAPWTAPSTASLHTGLFPARHQVRRAGGVLTDEATTLAEVLEGHGWHTFGISFNPHISVKTGFDQGFDHLDDFTGTSATYPDIDEMVLRVRDWLNKRPRKPFFLYLHPMNVHGPYRVPQAYRSTLLGHPPSREFKYFGRVMAGIMRKQQLDLRQEVSERFLSSLIEQYDSAIRYTTDKLGEIFSLLETKGLYDESLIVVTSDHGEELFEHGGFSHGYSLHREVLHVPLYIKLPYQRIGRTITSSVSLMDVYPTILQTLHIDVREPVDGRSLMPLLQGQKDPSELKFDRPFLAQTVWRKRCVARSIVRHPYKLIDLAQNYEGLHDQILLYNIVDDPEEKINLAIEKPTIVKQLSAELQHAFAQYEGRQMKTPKNVLDEMDMRRLKSLGYIR